MFPSINTDQRKYILLLLYALYYTPAQSSRPLHACTVRVAGYYILLPSTT